MKKIFWTGITGLILFELANVYFIMPFPGSQQFHTVDLAYFLHHWRWVFRTALTLCILAGFLVSRWQKKVYPVAGLLSATIVTALANYYLAADAMFKMPRQLTLTGVSENTIDSSRLIIGVEMNGHAKAYPIKILGYHHQVRDSLAGKALLVTYCTVCRTGRVYEPLVRGKAEHFRLVGMDHFNALIEDHTTNSWWRQATGEAIAGPLKGQRLPEVFSTQTSLAKWISLYPHTLILQEDPAFRNQYDTSGNYETGKSKKALTGTDSLSWKEKSWVIGLQRNGEEAVVDWNDLLGKRIIRDRLGKTPFLLLLAADGKSFFAFEDPLPASSAALKGDTLLLGPHLFKLNGHGIDTAFQLSPVRSYQEFWHSWRTFHPAHTKPGKE